MSQGIQQDANKHAYMYNKEIEKKKHKYDSLQHEKAHKFW